MWQDPTDKAPLAGYGSQAVIAGVSNAFFVQNGTPGVRTNTEVPR